MRHAEKGGRRGEGEGEGEGGGGRARGHAASPFGSRGAWSCCSGPTLSAMCAAQALPEGQLFCEFVLGGCSASNLGTRQSPGRRIFVGSAGLPAQISPAGTVSPLRTWDSSKSTDPSPS